MAQLASGAGCDAGWGRVGTWSGHLSFPMFDEYLHAFRLPGFRR